MILLFMTASNRIFIQYHVVLWKISLSKHALIERYVLLLHTFHWKYQTCTGKTGNLLIDIWNNLHNVCMKSKYMSVWERNSEVYLNYGSRVEFNVKWARQERSTLWHGGTADREEKEANVKPSSDINSWRDLSLGITLDFSWNPCLNFQEAWQMLVSALGDLFSLVVLSSCLFFSTICFVASYMTLIVSDNTSVLKRWLSL